MNYEFISNSPKDTIEFGNRFGKQLKGGEVVGISGDLGSGKTHLIKGIAAGTGVADSAQAVNSPTFVIVNEYKGRFDIYHIDAYRLKSLNEFRMLGFDDLCCPESVVLIEWAEKVQEALKDIDYVRIRLIAAGANTRNIILESLPEYIKL